MASSKITLKIIEKTYPSGTPYFHVTGRAYGNPCQKNFPTRDEAEVFMSELIATATQGKNAVLGKPVPPTLTVQTRLTKDEFLAAELAVLRLKAVLPNASITAAVEFYIEQKSVLLTHIKAADAVDAFLARRTARGNEENTTETSKTVLKKFLREKRIVTTADITPKNLTEFVLGDNTVNIRKRFVGLTRRRESG